VITNILITDQRYSDFLTIRKLDYETLTEQLNSGELDAAIILPERFVSDMMAGVNRPIEVIANEQNPLKSAVIRELMESAAAQITAAQSAINTAWHYTDIEGLRQNEINRKFNTLVMNYMTMSFSRDTYYKSKSVSAFGNYRIEHYFTASALSLFIFFSCTACIKPVIQNRSRNILSRLYSCGASPFRIALSNQLPVFFISFVQALSILAITTALSASGPIGRFVSFEGVTIQSALIVATAVAAVCLLTSSAICFFSNIFKNTEAAEIFSFSFIIVSAIVGGAIIPYVYLPEAFERFGAVTYSFWAQRAFLESAFGEYPANLTLLASIAATSIILLLISAGMIRKEITGSIK
jgi:ABC-2 type transport system permease protein